MYRVRTSNNIVPGVRTYKETTFAGSVTTLLTYPGALEVGESKRTTDVVTPDYRRKIERGEIINNPFMMLSIKKGHYYSGYLVQRNSGTGTAIKYYESDTTYASPPTPGSSEVGWWDCSDILMEAGTKAKAGVGQPDVTGLQELAESDQTLRLLDLRLRNVGKEVKRLTDNERRFLARNWNKFSSVYGQRAAAHSVSAASIFANNWLKWRYGILPGMNLVTDVIVGSSIRTARATSRGFASTTLRDQTSTSVDNGGNFFTDTFTIREHVTATMRAGILYSNNFGMMPNSWGLDSSNLIPTLWEVTPYSHVADWAYNVGDYLRSVSPKAWVDHLAHWSTLKIRRETTVSLSSQWKNYAGHTCIRSPSGGHAVVVEWTHRMPTVQTGIVRKSTPVSGTVYKNRVIDAFAMVVQQVLPLTMAKRALRGLQ